MFFQILFCHRNLRVNGFILAEDMFAKVLMLADFIESKENAPVMEQAQLMRFFLTSCIIRSKPSRLKLVPVLPKSV